MREQNVGRLNSTIISNDHPFYLHYTSYHKHLFSALTNNANGNLLDIGCGNKPYKDIVAPYINNYVGCDIVQSSETSVDVLCPANNIPITDESFDTVISTQTIEHVEDHQGLVNESFRLLKPGGVFILSGPLYWPLHEEPYDFFRFTKHGFSYLLKKSGFDVITIEANGGKWAVAGQALIQALHPQVYHVKGFKGKFARLLLRSIGGIKGINKFFSYLDDKDTDHTNTMNYVIVAKKPQV